MTRQSLYRGKERGLEFLEWNIIEEARQALEEGICVIKSLTAQRIVRTSEKTDVAGLRSGECRGCRNLVIFMLRILTEVSSGLRPLQLPM
jgi:hypothetical protein